MSNTIDISYKNVYGRCDLKCSYNFNYSDSNSTATNVGSFLVLSYEKSNIPPVVYNNNKYNVMEIVITCPSLHTFDGNKVEGEIILLHTPVVSGPSMSVCIPIIQSGDSTTASNLITQVIEKVANLAPGQHDSSNLNISGFNLQKIVPDKPYYSYTGTDTLPGDIIVYDKTLAIPLSEQTLNTLKKMVQPYPISVTGGHLFYNPLGPNQNAPGSEGDIYISCQPTGSSEEEVTISKAKNVQVDDMSTLFNFNNPIFTQLFLIVMSCLIFIIVFVIINYGLTSFTKTSTS